MERALTLPHQIDIETRSDGSMILRSAHALDPVAETTAEWLHAWAAKTPDAVFIAERSGAGWREVRYAEALGMVQALAGWLLAQGLVAGDRVLILSGNSVDHGLLALATQYVGLVSVPVAEQYSLIPGAHDRLIYAAETVRPKMLFADDPARYGEALALPALAGIPALVSTAAGAKRPVHTMAEALKGGAEIAAAHAAVNAGTMAKILFTSGSTSLPKGVITTHKMMCVNQAQIATAMPLLKARPPKILDWLPWNHVFGGSHNFNMMLANGGAIYIDDGKPTDALFGRTVENMAMHTGTLAFNVPVGFARVLKALEADESLRRKYFTGLDFTFYAGAALPQEIWKGIERMALEITGTVPLMISSWGLTETAPAVLLTHERVTRSGIIGAPLPGAEVKLIPDEDEGRFEVRARGPNIMPGYWENDAKTAEAFDEEGFFITGDAVKWVNPAETDRGLSFDGRISEDFKLLSGTWVRVAQLKGQLMTALQGIAADLIITGEGRNELGAIIFPVVPGQGAGLKTDAALLADIKARLQPLADAATGSSTRIACAAVFEEPQSLAHHEITAKGNLNIRAVLTRRAALVEAMHSGGPGSVRF
ncbi:MAG: feruloyl-CoA synthetase [Rhodobacteraceae bacterium]|nr:feruloyl-CoA synthetase [Paracoccaceae bacterium]